MSAERTAGGETGGGTLSVSVIAPDRVGYEGPAESVVAPAHDGELGILYGHAPMTVLLGEGELRLRSGHETHVFRVARGFLQVVDNEVSVLAEEIEEGDEDAG